MVDRATAIARSAEFIRKRDYQSARSLLLPLCEPGSPVDDATQLLALAQSRLGDFDAASRLYQLFLHYYADNAVVWNNFGNHLKKLDLHAALENYHRALKIKPDYPDALYNLALCQYELRQYGDALKTLDRMASVVAQAREKQLRGLIQLALQDNAGAAKSFRQCINLRPGDQNSLLNLAIALRRNGQKEQALDVLRRAGQPVSLGVLKEFCALQQELGDIDAALAGLTALVRQHPKDVDSHKMLDNLHFQMGKTDKVGHSLREAYSKTGDQKLLGQLALRLERLGSLEEATQVVRHIPELLESDPELALLNIRLHAKTGETALADELFEAALKRFPEQRQVVVGAVRHRVQRGDLERADQLIAGRLKEQPNDQEIWALQSTIWKLSNDVRYNWLCDYDRMIRVYQFDERDTEGALFEGVRSVLYQLHSTRHAPFDQTLRGGTQTFGALFNRPEPAIRQLVDGIKEFVNEYIALMPRAQEDPLTARCSHEFNFAGSWSVRLTDQGYHINHVHPKGWISSALYLSLPQSINNRGAAGHLVFGQSNLGLGDTVDPVEKAVLPEVGKMVLFPSYMWHGTIPFRGSQERLTVAFDVVPATAEVSSAYGC